MRKADYSRIAPFSDRARRLSEENVERWLGLIAERSRASAGARVLDLGCGTGRFALPMAQRLGYQVTGADASAEMLAKARAKDPDGLVTWGRQDAQALTYPDAAFDVVFLSHLLHHVDSPPAVIGECRRVLRPQGTIAIRYGAIELIRDDPIHRFFPETVAIDEARTPTVEQTEAWLRDAGFSAIHTEIVDQQTYGAADALLAAVRKRSTSVLSLISQEAFADGLRRLTDHVEKAHDDPWLLLDRMALTVGHKAIA
jgi:ubiquinone/menaquinone biosynthesis C-methylase UbiE